LSFNFFD